MLIAYVRLYVGTVQFIHHEMRKNVGVSVQNLNFKDFVPSRIVIVIIIKCLSANLQKHTIGL